MSAEPTESGLPATPVPSDPRDTCEPDGYCRLLDPGGRITAATWFKDGQIYVANWDGRVRLLNTRTGAVRTVLEGLTIPQGLTLLNGRLYVSDMGNVCDLMYEFLEQLEDSSYIEQCRFRGIKGTRENRDLTLMEFLGRTSAQILSYHVHDSGNLSDRQVVVDRIVSYGRDHSPNGLTNDGNYVYASIGHPQGSLGLDRLITANADQLEAAGRRTDLMGVIARFRPSDDGVEVFATGLRNVYGISIAPDGTVYGSDNDEQDGLATHGQREELNAIVKGGFYGFPRWGTNEAPPAANVIEPVAVLNGTASTMAHASEDGIYVAYFSIGEDRYVVDWFEYETFMPSRIYTKGPTYVTSILERDGLLYLITFSGSIHIIDPKAAPITSKTAR